MIEERKNESELQPQLTVAPRADEKKEESPYFFTEAEELPFHIPRD